MKKRIGVLLAAAMAAGGAWADTETVDGRTWTYSIYNDTAEIRDVSPHTGAVTIPSTLGGKPVTTIGQSAFFNYSGLRSVTIGNGVTRIGDHAFTQCHDLASVTIGNGVTIIGYEAFSDCSCLTNVTIGSGVTRIRDSAFWGCSGLTSVTIPASVTGIGHEVFAHCGKLMEITLPMWCKKNMYIYYSYSDYEWRFTAEKPDGIEPKSWQEYLGLSSNANITYRDVGGSSSGGSSGGDVAAIWKKAQTFNGAVFRGGKAVGLIQVKVGKASKNGEVSVSGTITGLDGKKLTAKGGKVAVNGESATATLTVKDGTSATVTIGTNGLSGSWNGATIAVAAVGGNWTRNNAKVYVDATSLPVGTVDALLPDGEPVIANGGKWSFAKAASVKWAKPKKGAALPDIYDEASGKGLIVDTSKGTNLSGLKLTYTTKNGTFKGPFKVYALEGASPKNKLKKYTVNVTGVVVDGVGRGQATCKRPAAGPWPVTVE